MIPFLGIDLTNDKNNAHVNGQEMITAKPTSPMAQALDSAAKKADALIERAKLPKVLRAMEWFSGITGMILGISIFRALIRTDSVGLIQGYQNVPWVFWIAGVCIVIWLILKLLGKQREQAVLRTEESAHIFASLESVRKSIYTQLDVPVNAPEVDVLTFFYKVKDTKIRPCTKGMQMAEYKNMPYRISVDAENMYLTNLEGKFSIPLASLQSIRTVKKNIQLCGWNKETAISEDVYKRYKLVSDKYGRVHCKAYHILEFIRNGQTWGIYFPVYELPVFEAITGLSAN